MKDPKILLYDVETFPNTGLFWAGKTWETDIIEVVKYGGLASVAWKFLGDKQIQCLTREGKKNDRQIVDKLWELFDEADIVVAHNGVAFDTKTTNTNIIKYHLSPPSTYQEVDTKREAKKYFRFDSNSLDNLAQFLGVGRKLPHKGFTMWKECMADDGKAWREMGRYNKHDVYLLEGCYQKLLPWMKGHPNVAVIAERPEACPKCLEEGTLQSRGFEYTKVTKFRRFQCTNCGGWSKARMKKEAA